MDVLNLPANQITILYDEAIRQQWIEARMMRIAYYADKKFDSQFNQILKIHGKRTKGFYKKEREKLKRKLNG